MQIRRSILAAVIATAIAAPSASAAVAVDGPRPGAADAGQTSGYAGIAAHRDAMSTRNWEPPEAAPVVRLVRADGDGFDWASAVIGASVPLAILIVDLIARPSLARRRSRLAAEV